jgi:hypothetical protein
MTFGRQDESRPPPRMNGTLLLSQFGSGYARLGSGAWGKRDSRQESIVCPTSGSPPERFNTRERVPPA